MFLISSYLIYSICIGHSWIAIDYLIGNISLFQLLLPFYSIPHPIFLIKSQLKKKLFSRFSNWVPIEFHVQHTYSHWCLQCFFFTNIVRYLKKIKNIFFIFSFIRCLFVLVVWGEIKLDGRHIFFFIFKKSKEIVLGGSLMSFTHKKTKEHQGTVQCYLH